MSKEENRKKQEFFNWNWLKGAPGLLAGLLAVIVIISYGYSFHGDVEVIKNNQSHLRDDIIRIEENQEKIKRELKENIRIESKIDRFLLKSK